MMPGGLLVGDVGGTNARFGMAVRGKTGFGIEKLERFVNDEFASFEDALGSYLATGGKQPTAACIAVAGPVHAGEVRLTNRDWRVSERALKDEFGISVPLVVNDFLAMARSVPELGADSFEQIFDGEAVAEAPIIVAGPGTGFGVATLLPSARGWTVLAGEGGHIAYAPRTDIERKLAAILTRDYGYVSNELVASGSGLEEVHKAFCELFGEAYVETTPEEMRAKAEAGDAMFAALIDVRAMAVMGAVGDLALTNGAKGGIVLAGGVSERISSYFKTPAARDRFVSRGPMSAYLERCPVRLLRNPAAPLIGAAAHFEQVRKA